MANGGRRKKEGKPRNGGALGVLIGQRAPGRGEWCLGEAGLVRGDSTASGRSEQAALRMAVRRKAGVAWRLGSASGTRVSVGGCQGAGQVALEGFPGSIWPRRETEHQRGERWR